MILTILLILLTSLTAFADEPADLVCTVMIRNDEGITDVCNSVAVSPMHAVALCTFGPANSVTVNTSLGDLQPDTIIVSPDLGIMIMKFGEDVFQNYQLPSMEIPDRGDPVSITGQNLDGPFTISGKALQRYPDGSILVSADIIDGLMGAAVFSEDGDFIGLITGLLHQSDRFSDVQQRDYLVLYPSQIWYMWAQLIVLGEEISDYAFGVTAMSSISLSSDVSSGIQIISVQARSLAWESGLRPGDLITGINGTPVYHPETLRGLLILSEEELTVTLIRNNFQMELTIPSFR